MATRYFRYRYSGTRQQIGRSGTVYWFSPTTITKVEDDLDSDWFLGMGSPESGIYYYRETDVAGNPIGQFPPINLSLRSSMVDTRRFPSDKGVPPAHEWKLITETLGDPTLYFHHIRSKMRGFGTGKTGGSGRSTGNL